MCIRSKVLLQHLDNAQILPASGQFADRYGCPACVSPEMLLSGSYSGQAADVWSLGIILYTLLVGKYTFIGSCPHRLFDKIHCGYYQVPDHVSKSVRSLISSLLAHDTSNRIPAWAALEHPWFKHTTDASFTSVPTIKTLASQPPNDQVVPI